MHFINVTAAAAAAFDNLVYRRCVDATFASLARIELEFIVSSMTIPLESTWYLNAVNGAKGDLTILIKRLSGVTSRTTRVFTQCAHFVPSAAVIPLDSSSAPGAGGSRNDASCAP